MFTTRHVLLGCLGLLACRDELVPIPGIPEERCVDAGSPPDLLPPPAKCAAAKGLLGDNLVCVDFSAMTLADLTSQGWDFTNAGGCPGWEIVNGKLQVKNFSTFMSSCGFTMKGLSAVEYQKYGSFTLSVVHRVDVSEVAQQKVQVMLGGDDPLTRLLTQWTGKQTHQQSVITMTKAELPQGSMGYQALFKLSATNTAGGSFTGWQIESIAVLGLP